MAKRVYLIWKDPTAPKTDGNWIQLSGKEFQEFCKTESARQRYFIRMGDDVRDGSDIIYIEATKEQHANWRKEYERHRYLVKLENENQLFSMNDYEIEEMLIEAALESGDNDPETIHISESARGRFRDLFFKLPELDRQLLGTLLKETHLTLEKLAKLYGSSVMTLRKRRSRLLTRMKQLSKEGKLTLTKMQDILSEVKKGEIARVIFKNEQLYQYFPKGYTADRMKKEILDLLKRRMELDLDTKSGLGNPVRNSEEFPIVQLWQYKNQ